MLPFCSPSFNFLKPYSKGTVRHAKRSLMKCLWNRSPDITIVTHSEIVALELVFINGSKLIVARVACSSNTFHGTEVLGVCLDRKGHLFLSSNRIATDRAQWKLVHSFHPEFGVTW